MSWLILLGLLVTAYLLGSFPSGVLFGIWFKGIDIRNYGSGKTGATNSLRTLGWKVALLVSVADALKGAIAVSLPRFFFTDRPDDYLPWVVAACAIAAMVGHNHSIFLGFRGGRGVMVGVGELLVVSWVAWVVVALFVVPTIAITRYVSLGSILGAIFAVFVIAANIIFFGLDPRYMAFILAAAAMIVYEHRDNIERLRNGTERKLGDKAKPATPAPSTPEHAGKP